jgi:hypothetical protein
MPLAPSWGQDDDFLLANFQENVPYPFGRQFIPVVLHLRPNLNSNFPRRPL